MTTTLSRSTSSRPSPDGRRTPGQALPVHLLELEGGAVRAGAVAKRLGVPVALVEQLRQAGRLLAVPDAQGYHYPSWQFEGRGLLSGLAGVLMVLQPLDACRRLVSLLTPNVRFQGQRPLDRLRAGAASEVMRVAGAAGNDMSP